MSSAMCFSLDQSKILSSGNGFKDLNGCLTLYKNDKILDWSIFKALADDKINVTQNLKFVLGKVENILGKGENAGQKHFLLFPKCFQKPPFSGLLKVGIVWLRVKDLGRTYLQ